MDPALVVEYPAWETLPHERLSPRSDTVGRRLAVLRRLAHPGEHPVEVVVAPVRSVLQPQLRASATSSPWSSRPAAGPSPGPAPRGLPPLPTPRSTLAPS